MVVDGSAGQRRENSAGSGNLDVIFVVGVADNGVSVRDVKIVADECNAEGRIEVVEKDGANRRTTGGIAQQGNPIALLIAANGSGLRFDLLHDKILGSADRCSRRRLRLHHQHVTVGQNIERAGMLQSGRDRLDFQSRRDSRTFSLLPPDH
jgi:hypothetical protein